MVETLSKVNAVGSTFLVAGVAHLDEQVSLSCNTDLRKSEAYSLAPLYAFLNDHPNVVVLKPKTLII